MENDKYFVPDIEDLRIGYSCQVREVYESITHIVNDVIVTHDEFNPFWKDHIITNGYDVVRDIELIKKEYIRSPYLTKEQIEAEGWTCIGQNPYINDNFYYFEKDGRYLDFNGITHEIKIGEDSEYPDYNGFCPSINEFRFICKLLKI